jgi:hypothetical protein
MTHVGPRLPKLCFANNDVLITSGTNKQAEREYAIWDTRKLEKEVFKSYLGNGLGIATLFFDEQHNLLYTCGRGEQVIGIYQYSSANPQGIQFISYYNGQTP